MTFLDFLRKEAPKKCVKGNKSIKNRSFDELEIVDEDIFFSKIKQTKIYDKSGNHVKNVIYTRFFEKGKDKNLEQKILFLLRK